MQSTHRLRTAALAALSVLPFAGFAASGHVFMNGQSIYGQPAPQGAPVRVVDLASTDDVSQLAPAGFAGKPLVVYVGRNPSNRR